MKVVSEYLEKFNKYGILHKEKSSCYNRNWFVCLLLSWITFGIYGLYFMHVVARDTNIACSSDGKHTRGLIAVILLSLITFGIYAIVWQLMVISRWEKLADKVQEKPKCSLISYVLWFLFGSIIIIGPLVCWIKQVKGLNQACSIHNSVK